MKHNIRRARFGKAYRPKHWSTAFKGRGFSKRIGGHAMYRDRQGRVITVARWAQLEENRAYRRVAQTYVGDIMISTIWTGMAMFDHDVFETMIFGGLLDGCQWRWNSVRQAHQGHDTGVRLVRLSLTHPEEVADALGSAL